MKHLKCTVYKQFQHLEQLNEHQSRRISGLSKMCTSHFQDPKCKLPEPSLWKHSSDWERISSSICKCPHSSSMNDRQKHKHTHMHNHTKPPIIHRVILTAWMLRCSPWTARSPSLPVLISNLPHCSFSTVHSKSLQTDECLDENRHYTEKKIRIF